MCDESLAFEEKQELCSWGLPEYILQKYLSKGVQKMFPWQVECLMSGDVLLGGNLLYSAPTSAGKTLVAEILAIKTVVERKKKVIVILPFVSVVREKMIYFQEILSGSGIRVEGFMGSYSPPGGFRSVHLAICTIEKANSLINRLMEERNLDDIGTIVIDELHLIGDSNRGYLLELLLTKLKFVCKKGLCANIQIIGMSATLPNLDLLASWMNATLYHTNFRPIPLIEHLKIGRSVYAAPDLQLSYVLEPEICIKNDPGDVVYLCLDTIIKGYSLIVFCPTKNWCETLAVQISSEIKRVGSEKKGVGGKLRNELKSDRISDILEQLKKSPVGLEKNLGQSVAFGVAYHHAGLTLEERDIIEGGFKQNILRVLVATSTLSSGVNLPARRVIIRSPGFQGQCMDILTYKQMIGRAGRMGKDSAGESFIICNENDKDWGKQLLTSNLPPVKSCLGQGNLSSSLKRALLEVTACGIVSTKSEIEEYTKCTLLAASAPEDKILEAIDSCTNYLEENEFIKLNIEGNILPSSLAEACLSASVPPDQALYLLKELHKARQCFVLDSDLHAIYQVTPYSICEHLAVDWMRFFTIWENLPINLQKIGELVGIEDRFLIRAMRGTINLNADEHVHKISIHKRFYTALVLQDLINEIPMSIVARKYDCNKGLLQSLQQSASTFAAMVTSFCKRLGWGGLEVLLSELSTRIQFGVQKDLLDLLRLDCMTALIARALCNASIVSITDLASSELSLVHSAICKTKPFQSEVMSDKVERRNIYLPGRPSLSEVQAAQLLIQEARKFLLKEMGVKTAEWEINSEKLVNDSVYERSTIFDDEKKNALETSVANNMSYEANISKNNISNIKECSIGQINSVKLTDDNRMLNAAPGSFKLVPEIDPISSVHGQVESPVKKENIDVPIFQSVNKSSNATFSFSSNYHLEDLNIRKKLEQKNEDQIKSVNNTMKPNEPLDDTELIGPAFLDRLIQKESTKSNENFILEKTLNSPRQISTNQLNNYKSTFNLSEFKEDLSFLEKDVKNCEYTTKGIAAFQVVNCLSDNKSTLVSGILDKVEINCRSVDHNHDEIKQIIPDEINGFEPAPLLENFNCSTPVSTYDDDEGDFSNNDMFLDSPQLLEINKKSEMQTLKNQTLEEFDINWGGDSLLETTHLEKLENLKQNSAVKRKQLDPLKECTPFKKKICLVNVNEKYFKEEPVNNYFHDSLSYNTQLENNIVVKDKFIKFNNKEIRRNKTEEMFSNSIVVDSEYLKLKSRPKSEGNLLLNTVNEKYHTNSLADAFDSTFNIKLTEMLKDEIEPLKHESDFADLNISDSDDFIVGSPEQLQKNQSDINYKNYSHGNNPPISSSKVTPKSSPDKYASPMKYPPIGGDIIKLSKSPSSKKTSVDSFVNLSPMKVVNKKAKCLMYEYSKICDNNLPMVKISEYSNNQSEVLKNVMKCKQMSFLVEIKKINETENLKEKIGGKIRRYINNKGQVDYNLIYGNEALVAIYFFDGKAVYNFDMALSGEKIITILTEIFSKEDLRLCGINTKKIFKLLFNCCRIFVKSEVFDVGVAEWLLHPEETSKSLDELSQEFFQKPIASGNNLESRIIHELVMLKDLQIELLNRLKKSNIEKLFFDIEMPIQKCLLYMELTGIGFDNRIVNELWSLSTELMGNLEMEAFTYAKQKFSLLSNSDLIKVCKNLKIPAEKELNNPLTDLVRDWRRLHTLKTKNLSQLLVVTDERCYCCSSIRSATGRIIIFDPDLQHIQRDFTIDEKLFSLRSAFIAKSRNILVSADYSQLELRILAHFSQDPVLIPLLRKNDDVFKNIAAEWNGISIEKVSDDMRQQVKQICYGIIYGMGDKTLGESLGISAAESSKLSAQFKRSFPKIDVFIKNTIFECQKSGKIKTISGRIRHLPTINSHLPSKKAQAERQAVNSKIQGSAADIAKKAMVEIEARLMKKFPQRQLLPTESHSSHLVLQLHDELIFEVNEDLRDCFITVLRDVMEKSTVLSVPLPVVIKVGKCWGNLEKIL